MDEITLDGAKYWLFTGLPTRSQLQKYTPNIVVMQPHIRHLIEKGFVRAVIDCEWLQENDYLHHRGSGMDAVVAQFCANHSVTIFANITKVYKQPVIMQASLLGRIQQNKKLADKFGTTFQLIQEDGPKLFSSVDSSISL